MKNNVKKAIKLATGVCTALGVVALGAVVASGTSAKVVLEGIKGARDAMRKTINALQTEAEAKAAGEESGAAAEQQAADAEITTADFEENTPEASEN